MRFLLLIFACECYVNKSLSICCQKDRFKCLLRSYRMFSFTCKKNSFFFDILYYYFTFFERKIIKLLILPYFLIFHVLLLSIKHYLQLLSKTHQILFLLFKTKHLNAQQIQQNHLYIFHNNYVLIFG